MLVNKTHFADHDAEWRNAVLGAFTVLTQLGLWDLLMEAESKLILAGADNEDPAALADRILEYRKKRVILQELHNLGKDK